MCVCVACVMNVCLTTRPSSLNKSPVLIFLPDCVGDPGPPPGSGTPAQQPRFLPITCVGCTGQGKRPEGPRCELPGVLSLWSHWRCLTPEPRVGPVSQELVRNATPGTSLGFPPGRGTQVGPWLGKQDLTCPGQPSPCAARPSTAKMRTRGRRSHACGLTGSCCHRHRCWHGAAGKQACSTKTVLRGAASRSHWRRTGGGSRNPGPRHPPASADLAHRPVSGQQPQAYFSEPCRRSSGGCVALREECPSALGRSWVDRCLRCAHWLTGGPRAGVPHPARSARPPWAGLGLIDAVASLTGSQGTRNGAWCLEVFGRRSRVRETGGLAFPSEGRFPAERLAGKGCGTR